MTIPWDKYEGYREVTAYPEVFDEQRFGINALWSAARKADVLFRGWPFIFVDDRKGSTTVIGDSLETIVDLTDIRSHEHFETWQLRTSGLFFHRTLMDEETYPPALERGKMLDYIATIYHVSEAIGSLWRLFEALDVPDDESITMEFRYTGTAGRHLTSWDPRRVIFFRNSYVCKTQTVERRRRMSLGLWRATDWSVAAEVCCEIFQQFQWIDPNRDEVNRLTREFLSRVRFTS